MINIEVDLEERDDPSADSAAVQEYLEWQNKKDADEAELSEAALMAAAIKESEDPGDELIPITMADAIFSMMIFDAEKNLISMLGDKWVVDGIIPCNAFGTIYGAPGSYKSFMALDMAACVSSGEEKWHGFDVDSPGPVLYVAAEGAFGLQERAVAWEKHHKKKYGDLVILPFAVMMDNPQTTQAFIEAAMMAQERIGKPFRLVVIDTLARSFSGDENSSQDTGAFVNACSAWRRKLSDCTVIVVTHSGKNVDRGMRGSSAIEGACDFIFRVTRPKNLKSLLRNEKQKDASEAEDMHFSMEVSALGMVDKKGRARSSLVPILESIGAKDDESDEDGEEAFPSSDAKKLAQQVRAAEVRGEKMTEEKLREDFIGERISEGIKRDSAGKAYRRAMVKAQSHKLLTRSGNFVSTYEQR